MRVLLILLLFVTQVNAQEIYKVVNGVPALFPSTRIVSTPTEIQIFNMDNGIPELFPTVIIKPIQPIILPKIEINAIPNLEQQDIGNIGLLHPRPLGQGDLFIPRGNVGTIFNQNPRLQITK